ncbi:MAG: antibiotic biosynthesis monooxygenase [Armatimonadetes bacterium]|nr:antibiotic biosynthesis monooxygenase [Armatimonadota bacterium]
MVKLIARLQVKPGQEEFVAEALKELAGPSRAEAGCIRYEPCRAKEDPAALLVLEEWESQEALDAHMATPHFQAFVGKIGEALAGPPSLEFIEPL